MQTIKQKCLSCFESTHQMWPGEEKRWLDRRCCKLPPARSDLVANCGCLPRRCQANTGMH